MKTQLSIVVPCYNEVLNLPNIFAKFDDILAKRTDIEVILVNNGSTDNSAQVFEKEISARKEKNIKLVNVMQNQGYGYGILSGLEQAFFRLLPRSTSLS